MFENTSKRKPLATPHRAELTENDWAYLAGLVDGDGCLGIQPTNNGRGHNYYRASLSILMTGHELLELPVHYGAGNITNYRASQPRCKDFCRWQIGLSDLRSVLPQIKPYMRFRRHQAEVMTEYISMDKGELDRKADLCRQMKELNFRGAGHERATWPTPDKQAELTEMDWSYLAGLVDGEGCFSIVQAKNQRGIKYYNTRLSIMMTGRELVDLPKYYGVGSICHLLGRQANHRDSWRWTIGLYHLRTILPRIKPYLRFKKRHAEVMSAYIAMGRGEMDVKANLYLQMRELNFRGLNI